MKFSTRSHYGLRAVLSLARAYGRGPLPLSDIANEERLSLGYLEQLLLVLRNAGLVQSARGVKGGYQLCCHPSEVTVGQVLRALDGPLTPIECVSDNRAAERCGRENDCASRVLWQRMRDSVASVVDSTTLADLCRAPTPQTEKAATVSQPEDN